MCFHAPSRPPQKMEKEIPFLRNIYKIRHHKKDNGNPIVNYFNLIVKKIHVLPRQNL